MSSKQNVPVVLRVRVIVADNLISNAEREVTLAIQPFVGLNLYNSTRVPPGCDFTDEKIQAIAYDLKTGQVICYLPLDDFRRQSSGGDWTEDEVRKRYQDWKLDRDTGIPRKWERNGD